MEIETVIRLVFYAILVAWIALCIVNEIDRRRIQRIKRANAIECRAIMRAWAKMRGVDIVEATSEPGEGGE